MRNTEMSVRGGLTGGNTSGHSSCSSFFEYCEFASGRQNGGQAASCSVMIGWCYTLPFRFSGQPVKRKLTRMMLQLEKARFSQEQYSNAGTSPSPVADYLHSLMDTAVSQGELLYRSSDEMVRHYLSLTGELNALFAASPRPELCLRHEVRRSIEQFLKKYAAGTGL